MHLKDIVKELADRSELTQTKSREVLDNLIDIVHEELKKPETTSFTLPKLVVFKKTFKEAHQSRNPGTGEMVQVPGRFQLRASPNDSLKKEVREA